VSALGAYLCDVQPRPTPSALRCVRRFVRSNAYAAGEAAREIAVREVTAQWLHLHAVEQLRAAHVFDGLSPCERREIELLCCTSTVREELRRRLGPALCELTLQLLSGDMTAAHALEHAAFRELREAERLAALAEEAARAAHHERSARRSGRQRPSDVLPPVGCALVAAGEAGADGRYKGGLKQALPDALAELLGIAVLEVVTVTAAVCSTVCTRVPMAGLAVRAVAPLARRAGLPTLGCRALELTGVSFAEVEHALQVGVLGQSVC